MPEMRASRRGSGGDSRSFLRTGWRPCAYGSATTDPLGREGEGWHKSEQSLLPTLRKGWRRGADGRAVRVETRETKTN